jgi:hypothetical protein
MHGWNKKLLRKANDVDENGFDLIYYIFHLLKGANAFNQLILLLFNQCYPGGPNYLKEAMG